MLSLFLENLKRLSVFIVISQTILHFGVGKKYEKYIKLILSFMIVGQLVFAISSYFNLDNGFMTGFSKENYYNQWEQYMVGLEEEYKVQQSSLDQRLEEKYVRNDENNKGDNVGIKVEKIAIP